MSLTLSSTAGSDYNDPVVTTVIFGPGVTRATYPVPIVDDSNMEDTETFTASLSTTESNVDIGDGTATVTILDDDSELFTTCSDMLDTSDSESHKWLEKLTRSMY